MHARTSENRPFGRCHCFDGVCACKRDTEWSLGFAVATLVRPWTCPPQTRNSTLCPLPRALLQVTNYSDTQRRRQTKNRQSRKEEKASRPKEKQETTKFFLLFLYTEKY